MRMTPYALAAACLLAACSPDAPCVVCFEDEWSREPFPGQPKQHLKPLSPDSPAQGVPPTTREFLGQPGPEKGQPF